MQKNKVFKEIIVASLMIVSFSGIVFANDISKKIYDNIFNTGNGMGHAIEEGYIEDVNMKEQTSNTSMTIEETGEVIKDLETIIKVTDVIMDDYNLSMIIEVNLSDEALKIVDPSDIWDFNFEDIIIYDENNTIMYNAVYGNKLDEIFGKDNYVQMGSGLNYFITNRGENPAKVVYNLFTGGNGNSYPKSRKLYFKLSRIGIECTETTLPENREFVISGNWEFEVDVPEKMYNRERITYVQIKTTNPDFNVVSASLLETGMEINLEMKNQVEPELYESPMLKFYNSLPDGDNLKSNEIFIYISNINMQTQEMRESFEERVKWWQLEKYLVNSNGEKFEFAISSAENGGGEYFEDTHIRTFNGLFDLTKYDATDVITLYVKDYQGKEAEITLEKVGG